MTLNEILKTCTSIHQVIAHTETRAKWSSILDERLYQSEASAFLSRIDAAPKLGECTVGSLALAFFEAAELGLSWSMQAKHLYLIPRGEKVGSGWINKASIMVSPYGEAALRQKHGIIAGYDNPVLIYSCDDFNFDSSTGKVECKHRIPSEDDKIVGGYVRIHLPNGLVCFTFYTSRDFSNWQAHATKKITEAARKAEKEAQYKEEGFLKAKILKHAIMGMNMPTLGENMPAFTAMPSPNVMGDEMPPLEEDDFELPTE